MMKDINVYMIHSKISSISDFISFLRISALEEKYNFVWNPKKPDYLFASDEIYTYPKKWEEFKKLYTIAKVKVINASEAFSPDWNVFDYGIGFDTHLSNGDRFCRLPPAILFYDKFYNADFLNVITSMVEASVILKEKTGFCNFLYSNYNAHPNRDKLFYSISSYKKVDSLGKHLNNVGTKATGFNGYQLECIPMQQKYKFSIASENALYNGYTSEKILTSLYAHTVPIYWGNPDIGSELNSNAFINCHQFETQEELLDRIKEIDCNDRLWCEMVSEPWQTETQKKESDVRMKNYMAFMNSIFEHEYTIAKRVPEGTFVNGYRKVIFSGKIPHLNMCRIIRKKITRILNRILYKVSK